MDDLDVCVHLAGLWAYRDMQKDWTIPTIVDGTRDVFESVKTADLGRVDSDTSWAARTHP